jgi:pimeloyl-ACP methyl ester carboxylesterase
MPAVSTNGISLHFEITGAGPPLCLISGYRQSSRAWPLPFIARLGERYRIVTFDNRGTGLSDKPADGYDLPNQAKDVLGLLDALGLSRVHLLGFSMGGAVAQQVVAAAPERIDRLILFGTFCGGLRSELAPWSVLRRLFVTDGMTPEQAARQMLPVTYSPDYLAANLETVEQQMRRELMYPTPGFAARRQIEALRSFDSYYDLPQVTSATLVATGTADQLVMPRNSAIIASRIPGARLEMLDDLGHRAIWEAPDEMAELIGDFLAMAPAAGFSEGRDAWQTDST